jgi:hypothetical protein
MIIDKNEFYEISDTMIFCCDESQFTHFCIECGDNMGCYFCEFNSNESHDCMPTVGSRS